jgi:hypothetical protein
VWSSAGQPFDFDSEQQNDDEVMAIRALMTGTQFAQLECTAETKEMIRGYKSSDKTMSRFSNGADGRLYRLSGKKVASRKLLYIPANCAQLRARLLAAAHADGLSGHYRLKNTIKRLTQSYFWMSMRNDAKAWILACTCRFRNMDYVRPLNPFRQIQLALPWEAIQVDVYGPLVKSFAGNRFIVNIIDTTSGEQKLEACKTHTAAVIADAICRRVLVEENMTPTRISSDNASELKGKVATALAHAIASKWQTGVPYHPQSQAAVERSHRPLAVQLTMCCKDENQRDCDQNLLAIESAIRTGTKEGSNFSRLFLKTGRDNCTPIDRVLNAPTQLHAQPTIAKALETLALARLLTLTAFADAQKERQRRLAGGHSVQNDFDTGDQVMLHLPTTPPGLSNKLYFHMTGPFTITKWEDGTRRTCTLADNDDARVSIRASVDHLIHWHDTPPHLQLNRRVIKLPLTIWPKDEKESQQAAAEPPQPPHPTDDTPHDVTEIIDAASEQDNGAEPDNEIAAEPDNEMAAANQNGEEVSNAEAFEGDDSAAANQNDSIRREPSNDEEVEGDEAAVANQNDGIIREPELRAEQHAAEIHDNGNIIEEDEDNGNVNEELSNDEDDEDDVDYDALHQDEEQEPIADEQNDEEDEEDIYASDNHAYEIERIVEHTTATDEPNREKKDRTVYFLVSFVGFPDPEDNRWYSQNALDEMVDDGLLSHSVLQDYLEQNPA